MVMARIALLALLALAGCGDTAAAPAEPSGAAVVRGWADDLRRGDIDAASARFALPAVVANNTPELTLETRAEVRFFNASLPCGGEVTAIVSHAGYLIATIALTERPGATCGDGVGGVARTAFLVRDGKITRWLRLPGGDALPRADGEEV
jgi:hypothetical protein